MVLHNTTLLSYYKREKRLEGIFPTPSSWQLMASSRCQKKKKNDELWTKLLKINLADIVYINVNNDLFSNLYVVSYALGRTTY